MRKNKKTVVKKIKHKIRQIKMDTFNPNKRSISTYEQFLKDREKAEKAKHIEKGEADIVKKSMDGEKDGTKGYAVLDESESLPLDIELVSNAIQVILKNPISPAVKMKLQSIADLTGTSILLPEDYKNIVIFFAEQDSPAGILADVKKLL
jgi:hypothetical protein